MASRRNIELQTTVFVIVGWTLSTSLIGVLELFAGFRGFTEITFRVFNLRDIYSRESETHIEVIHGSRGHLTVGSRPALVQGAAIN